MPEILEHAGGAARTTIDGTLAANDTTFDVLDATGWPTGSVGPFVVTIEPGGDNSEKVLCESLTGTTVTVATDGRGWDNTADVAHPLNATIIHSFSAVEAEEANVAAVLVSEATGGLVGVTKAQTLTNKTVALGSNTVSGTLAQFNTAVSDADLASLAGSETLLNKTLTEPTIGSHVNAQHDHSSAAGGGAILKASVTGLVTSLDGLTAADAALDTRLDTAETNITALDADKAETTVTDALDTRLDTAESDIAALEAGTAVVDSGWLDITLNAALKVSGSFTPQYRKVGKQVFLRGQFDRVDGNNFATGASTAINSVELPAAYCPPLQMRFAVAARTQVTATQVDVGFTGFLNVVTPQASTGLVQIVSLNNINYWTD